MKPCTPKYSIKAKTRRYYPAGSATMTISQKSDTLSQAKTVAWCHSQTCPSHQIHIRRSNGIFIVNTTVYPKNMSQLHRILEFVYGVNIKLAKKDCDDDKVFALYDQCECLGINPPL